MKRKEIAWAVVDFKNRMLLWSVRPFKKESIGHVAENFSTTVESLKDKGYKAVKVSIIQIKEV
jgi:hypothetical protein